MGSIPEFTEIYYEARAFGGYETLPQTPTSPALSAGLGLRIGSGPLQGTLSGFWGPRPDFDFKVEYAGYGRFGPIGLRVTAGIVVTRDATRGTPEWTEGFCGGVDVGGAKHWEVFTYVAHTDNHIPRWEPFHGVMQLDVGGRYLGKHIGVEIRDTWRFGYEQGGTLNLSVSLLMRLSATQRFTRVSRTTPLELIGREPDDP